MRPIISVDYLFLRGVGLKKYKLSPIAAANNSQFWSPFSIRLCGSVVMPGIPAARGSVITGHFCGAGFGPFDFTHCNQYKPI
jgi:hypothetical protein